MNKQPEINWWLIGIGVFFLINIAPILIVIVIFAGLAFGAYKLFSAQQPGKSADLRSAIDSLFDSGRDNIIDIDKLKKSNFPSFSPPQMNPLKLSLAVVPLILVTLIAIDGVYSVPAGKVAVIFDRSSGVLADEVGEGLHLKIPFWQTVARLNVRLQEMTMSSSSREGALSGDDSIRSLTKDGQQVSIDVTVQYKVDAQKASDLYQNIGIDYRDKVVRPRVRSVIREVITGYTSEELFGLESRQAAAIKMESQLRDALGAQFVILDSVLIRNVLFSQTYLNAIEQKKVQVQINEKTELEKVAAENRKQIKIVEAQGEAEAIRLKGEALSVSPEVIQLQFVEKMAPSISWGILPDGALPLIDIASLKK